MRNYPYIWVIVKSNNFNKSEYQRQNGYKIKVEGKEIV